MSRGVRWFLIGSAVLVTLAGCGRGFLQYGGEREPWRHEAEVACLNSGTVKEGAGVVSISPIEGPGMCGADFPLKVSALGEGPALGYVDEPVRPPGSIAGRSRPAPQPRWPISQQQPYAAAAAVRAAATQPGAPMSIEAPGSAHAAIRRSNIRSSRCSARRHPICRRRRTGSAASRPADLQCRAAAAPQRRAAARRSMTRRAAALCAARRRADGTAATARPPQPLPPLGPPRNPQMAAATADRGQAGGDARLSDRLGARSLVRQRGAAGGAQVVQPAGGRDQADLGLFLPRHERPARRAYFRARLRQRARHRGLRAGRRPPHHGQGRLERLAGGAGLSPRRAGLGLRPVHHGAGAGLQPVPLRPHPRRPDAARERPAHLPAGRGGRRSGGVARPRQLAIRRRGRSSRRRRGATIRRSSRAAIRSPGAATPAAAIRPPPARSPRGGPGSRTRRPTTSTGSRSRARGRRSTGATTSATRSIEPACSARRRRTLYRLYRGVEPEARRRDRCVSREYDP